jgi:tetratricopeptide (TPR) repeat protein
VSGQIANLDPAMPKIPDALWRESGRPATSWLVRSWIALLLIAAGWVLASFVAPVGVYGWAVAALGVVAFFAIPALVDAIVLQRFAARVEAVERTRAHKLLDELRGNTTIKMLAPHGWMRIQEAKLHLAVDEHRAAAKAFAEAERVSKHAGDKAELISAQAHALALAGDRREARELLGKLAKLERLSDLDHFNFGIVLLSEPGHGREAVGHLEQASESFGEHPRLLAAMVLARQRCEQIDKATALLEQAEAAVEASGDLLAQDLLKRAKKALRPLLKTKVKRERKAGASESAKPTSSTSPASAASPASSAKLAAKSEKPKGKKGRKQARRDARKQARSAERRGEPGVETPVEAAVVATPAAVEKPAVIETPAVVATPATVEKPAVVETPAVVEKPAVVEMPAVVEKPAVVETPAPIVETPAPIVETPITEDKPVETPAVVDKPITQDKPVEVEKPAEKPVEKPVVDKPAETPAVVDKPITQDKPAEKPAVVDKPFASAPVGAKPKPASRDEDEFDLASLARDALSSGARPKTDDAERSSTSGIRPIEPSSSGSMFRSSLFASEPEAAPAAAKPSLFGLPKFGDVPKFTPPPMPPRGTLLPPKPADSKPAEPKPAEPKPAPAAAKPIAPKPVAPITAPSTLGAPKPPAAAPGIPAAPSLPGAPSLPKPGAFAAPKPSTPVVAAPALDDGWGDLGGDLAPPVVPSNTDNDAS